MLYICNIYNLRDPQLIHKLYMKTLEIIRCSDSTEFLGPATWYAVPVSRARPSARVEQVTPIQPIKRGWATPGPIKAGNETGRKSDRDRLCLEKGSHSEVEVTPVVGPWCKRPGALGSSRKGAELTKAWSTLQS